MIRGVNLGGWLALERWITPNLFEGIAAADEREFYEELGWQQACDRLVRHRESFIDEKDFAFIHEAGCSLIRLPVPYSVFGDVEGRLGCIEYVDRAFEWAERYGLDILIDLHTVPGCANGLENGGVCGLCTWHQDEKNVDVTLDVLERLASRYAKSSALFGIEPVNEPASKAFLANAVRGYRGRYDDRLEKSTAVPSTFLRDFYERAYRLLVPIMGEDRYVVLQDGFRLGEWDDVMPPAAYPAVMIDTHQYLNFARYELGERNLCRNYFGFAWDRFAPALDAAAQHHPVLVGEWTLAHRPGDLNAMSSERAYRYWRAIAEVQQATFSECAGWVYFTYRVDDPDRPAWDFRNVVNAGWLSL
ncbi:cellulase family glycosylhydrolase [Collinsella sp. An2]|uniref:glycoside hydrolase family 5 protein n=1 Tax=Collinsella sp. An2 TaxID=1965585 RepID=UPI000B3A7139|nr:cellulase family glycosylhydrolase [Collinsella sp. An2]OUP11073.1 hypothetical protein B5F33_01470 [Collinsella sp. An2]